MIRLHCIKRGGNETSSKCTSGEIINKTFEIKSKMQFNMSGINKKRPNVTRMGFFFMSKKILIIIWYSYIINNHYFNLFHEKNFDKEHEFLILIVFFFFSQLLINSISMKCRLLIINKILWTQSREKATFFVFYSLLNLIQIIT